MIMSNKCKALAVIQEFVVDEVLEIGIFKGQRLVSSSRSELREWLVGQLLECCFDKRLWAKVIHSLKGSVKC